MLTAQFHSHFQSYMRTNSSTGRKRGWNPPEVSINLYALMYPYISGLDSISNQVKIVLNMKITRYNTCLNLIGLRTGLADLATCRHSRCSTTAIFDANLGQFKCEFDCPIRELPNGFLRIFSYSLLFLFRDRLRRAIMEMS